jgi:serine/threonine protein kinase
MENWSETYDIFEEFSPDRRGKFGRLYLLKHKISSELFVLKTITKTTYNRLAVQQVKNESTFHFECEGLPEIISRNETENDFSFIKKYESGLTLDEYLKNIRKKDKLKAVQKLSLALWPLFNQLEKAGIAHCDIKPQNIILEEINTELQAKLIDFGLSIRLPFEQSRKTIFQLSYSAPELVLNRLNCVDFSSDIYSLGLIFYRFLTDENPFHHANPAVATNLQITYPLPENRRIPKAIWPILKKACFKHSFKKSPNKYERSELDEMLVAANLQRYRSFSEFNQAIQLIELTKKRFSISTLNLFGNPD